ncbi:MAG: hypothetical protein PVF93_08955 [Chromatiaceae bacterium]|jgi:hypothetical protein
MRRYHVTLGSRRTTASLDTLLSDLLAIRLGARPQSSDVHHIVRTWLQQQLDQGNDPGRCLVSQWLRDQAVLFLVDKTLSDAYLEQLLDADSGFANSHLG